MLCEVINRRRSQLSCHAKNTSTSLHTFNINGRRRSN